MNYVSEITGERNQIEHYLNLNVENMEGEVFKQFYEGKIKNFFVSNYGRIKTVVKSNKKAMIKKQKISNKERLYINITDTKVEHVSRLVAKAFIPNPNNLPVVAHIDNNPKNNCVDNLRFDTQSGNMQQARDDGRLKGFGIPQPAVALDSNGKIISYHDGVAEALKKYEGKWSRVNSEVQIVGNVIIMRQSYFESLSENERLNMCYELFQRMLKVVNEQLIDEQKQTAEIIGCSNSYPSMLTKDKFSADYNGHKVTRLKNMLGVTGI